ncbi:nucleotide exchange factor GrpE [Adhaeribacter sp. BT258]|uniref:Protein GrpE n=2 Tax=Adhaeribacter terrigena TaxID=2793070 RepID=A0ABS1BXH4_9BACT|nr:nucleotide exchange factor GrpE [Adhaeribacter terrigena]
MKTGKDKNKPDSEEHVDKHENVEGQTVTEEQETIPADHQMPDVPTDTLSKTEEELSEMKDKYLRLFSDFENFRRRTSKERLELMKSGGEDVMTALLPVMDDLDRAKMAMENATDVDAVKEGLELVFGKLASILQQKGLKPMDAKGQPFDADLHDAITQTPAGDEMKGKVVDEIEKGYYLNDKVIRFAKVVIGA